MRWLIFLGCWALLFDPGLYWQTELQAAHKQLEKGYALQAKQHPAIQAELTTSCLLPLLEEQEEEQMKAEQAGRGWFLLIKPDQMDDRQLLAQLDRSKAYYPPPES
jgi:hypothetical protein